VNQHLGVIVYRAASPAGRVYRPHKSASDPDRQ